MTEKTITYSASYYPREKYILEKALKAEKSENPRRIVEAMALIEQHLAENYANLSAIGGE